MMQDAMIERKQYQERAILNRMAYLRQHCTCFLFCTGKKEFLMWLVDQVATDLADRLNYISGSKLACEELMRLETKLANGLN